MRVLLGAGAVPAGGGKGTVVIATLSLPMSEYLLIHMCVEILVGLPGFPAVAAAGAVCVVAGDAMVPMNPGRGG